MLVIAELHGQFVKSKLFLVRRRMSCTWYISVDIILAHTLVRDPRVMALVCLTKQHYIPVGRRLNDNDRDVKMIGRTVSNNRPLITTTTDHYERYDCKNLIGIRGSRVAFDDVPYYLKCCLCILLLFQ